MIRVLHDLAALASLAGFAAMIATAARLVG